MVLCEVCIDSVQGAIAAEQGGAQRVELCDNLVEGGTTPSLGTIETTLHSVKIDVNVIIRPRGGDFYYTEHEFAVMERDILAAKAAGARGVVIGLLLPDGQIDVERTQRLVKLARPLSVTFHRAFDMSRDPEEALETLVKIGVDRVLTTGQKFTAIEGFECIAKSIRQAGNRIIVMPGGVSPETVGQFVEIGARECHFGAFRSFDSPMHHRNHSSIMGSFYQPDEYRRQLTDPELVRQVVEAARRASA